MLLVVFRQGLSPTGDAVEAFLWYLFCSADAIVSVEFVEANVVNNGLSGSDL